MEFYKSVDFITNDEIKLVKTKLFDLKDHWIPCLSYLNGVERYDIDHLKYVMKNMYVFGDAIYLLASRDMMNKEVRSLIEKEFSWLYSKLAEKIEDIFGKPIVYNEELPLPGFHIFHGEAQKELRFGYHTDTNIKDIKNDVNNDVIYSFTSLISKPDDGNAWLEYDGNNRLDYEFGKLHIWNGSMNHRIGEFDLKENDARITLQGHLYEEDNKLNLYF